MSALSSKTSHDNSSFKKRTTEKLPPERPLAINEVFSLELL